MLIAGIDFSLNGPSVCLFDNTKEFNWSNVDVYYISKTQKYIINNDTLHGDLLQEQPDNFHRWEYLKAWCYDKIQDCDFVLIEGYSYSSKGSSIFQIAEASGITKQNIWTHNIQIETVPPKTIKKYYTDNGNAGKPLMYQFFKVKTGVNLIKMLDYKKAKIDSPIGDIVDSFSILSYAIDHYHFV